MNALSLLIGMMGSKRALLPAGALAQWKGEGNANDEGATYNGSPGVGTAYGTGYDGVNQAFSFNGNTNSAVGLPIINLGSAWSIDCWFKATLGASPIILFGNNGTTTGTFGYWEVSNSGVIRYIQFNTTTVASTIALLTGNWYKGRLTYDGSKIRIYVNHTLVATESSTHSETFNAVSAIGYVKAGTADNAFNGLIDEATYYNSALVPALNGNLMGHWVGNSNNDSEWTWHMTPGSTPLYTTDHNGVANNAWSFNGSDNNIRTFQDGIVPGGLWTLDFRLNVAAGSAGTNRGILKNAFNAAATQFGDLIWNQSTKNLSMYQGGVNVCNTTSNSILSGATWYHVKATYDGTNFRIYIDGVLNVTSGSATGKSWAAAGSNVSWGKSEAGYPASALIGAVADAMVYNAVV